MKLLPKAIQITNKAVVHDLAVGEAVNGDPGICDLLSPRCCSPEFSLHRSSDRPTYYNLVAFSNHLVNRERDIGDSASSFRDGCFDLLRSADTMNRAVGSKDLIKYRLVSTPDAFVIAPVYRFVLFGGPSFMRDRSSSQGS